MKFFRILADGPAALRACKPTVLSLTTQIILALIVLHLLVGFGWLIYKLSPRKEDKPEDDPDH